jgi:hypothetical protein
MNTTILFDRPQKEIASLINARLSHCTAASIVTGFLTPSGLRAIAGPLRARPNILQQLVVGAATYAGFQALDVLVNMGVPIARLRVHLGHTRESGSRKRPIVRHHPMLHSKIYYMELPGDQACAFVGSNNLTSFALRGLNGEACVLLEGPASSDQFIRIRAHIQSASAQATPYTSGMREAFAWWTREFLEGLVADVALPRDCDWEAVRTILIFAQADPKHRIKVADSFYFELPARIAIDSLRTEAHLFLFTTLPPDPWHALYQLPQAHSRYTCNVHGAENQQANVEVRTMWRIDPPTSPILHPVPTQLYRPTPSADTQQLLANVIDSSGVKLTNMRSSGRNSPGGLYFPNAKSSFPKVAPPIPSLSPTLPGRTTPARDGNSLPACKPPWAPPWKKTPLPSNQPSLSPDPSFSFPSVGGPKPARFSKKSSEPHP